MTVLYYIVNWIYVYTLKIIGLKIDPLWVNIAPIQYWVNFTEQYQTDYCDPVLDTTSSSFTLKP